MKTHYFIFVILASFSLIFLISSVSASYYSIEFNQIENKVLVTHNIDFDEEQSIIFQLPSDFSSLSISKPYSLTNNELSFREKDIKISYITKSLIEPSSKGHYFITKIPFLFNFDKLTIKLILSEGHFVSENKIFPKPSSIETDGKQIIIIWNVTNVSKDFDFPIFVSIESKNSIIIWIVYVLFFVIICLVIYFVYDKYLKKTKKEKKSIQKEDIEKYLMDSEKVILNALKQADRGELWQKQLQLQTGFSKAKLSRIIRNLEARNLIDKIPFGNTNKIRLK
ncbi:MAG: hypothetical protein N3D20_02120 [Candidatus Pacearchaeota archaeon]|nr:hypothetical protein [Candidatus Pacearchaeota archaeon]